MYTTCLNEIEHASTDVCFRCPQQTIYAHRVWGLVPALHTPVVTEPNPDPGNRSHTTHGRRTTSRLCAACNIAVAASACTRHGNSMDRWMARDGPDAGGTITATRAPSVSTATPAVTPSTSKRTHGTPRCWTSCTCWLGVPWRCRGAVMARCPHAQRRGLACR